MMLTSHTTSILLNTHLYSFGYVGQDLVCYPPNVPLDTSYVCYVQYGCIPDSPTISALKSHIQFV